MAVKETRGKFHEFRSRNDARRAECRLCMLFRHSKWAFTCINASGNGALSLPSIAWHSARQQRGHKIRRYLFSDESGDLQATSGADKSVPLARSDESCRQWACGARMRDVE
jgi:hypothetical protein